MARLLFRGEWFDALLPDAVYEIDFEEHLRSQATHLYPGYRMVPFKMLLESENGTGRPDLALIRLDYRDWWVVEVELGTHSLREHVARQVAVFSTARYESAVADYLVQKEPSLDVVALREMLLGSPPRVLVLVNQVKPEWARELRRWDALVGVIEVFRDDRNNVVLRVNGEHPSAGGSVITSCRIDPILRKSLVVDSPASLGVQGGERLVLWYEGGTTEWKRVDARNVVWLMPLKRCPLRKTQGEFDIVRDAEGRLVLEGRNRLRRRSQ